jgi:hypothetical protein
MLEKFLVFKPERPAHNAMQRTLCWTVFVYTDGMMLNVASLSSECAAALEAYEAAVGVIHFEVFSASDRLGPQALHRQATVQAHDLLQAGLRSEPVVQAQISVAEFLGVISTSVGVFDRPETFLEARAHALDTTGSFSMSPADGFVYAFADPPYGLGLSSREAQTMFDAICEGLFGSFNDDLEIQKWSNDWSSYFDAGHEWWGAFWWTIHNRTRNTVIVVSASASD